MSAYYNEFDPKTAAWLRELIKDGLIADGEVDERSIVEVQPDDVKGFRQCHFFAGIGGWSYALRLAGFPDDRSVWTGSPPCQPFSAAGQRKGGADERHLWPEYFRLIRECAPATVFGEQVAAAIGNGWLDAVFADMESEGYACAAAVLPACSVGAPHIRQRLWFMADSTQHGRRQEREDSGSLGAGDGAQGRAAGFESGGYVGAVGNDSSEGLEARQRGAEFFGSSVSVERSGIWSDLEWLNCADGKARPTKPGLFPLAHGIPGRVASLRGAGNAIVPQVAQAFIESAIMELEDAR